MNAPTYKHQNEARTAAGQRKILLVDDDVDVCEVLKATLEWHGYEVTVAHRAVEGVLKVMQHDFDAILCDMMMPVMPGDMFYVAVQRVKPHLCERFIFITAHPGNPKTDSFLRITPGQVLYEPLATEQLVATVARTIEFTTMRAEKVAATLKPKWTRQDRASYRHRQPADEQSNVWEGDDGKLRGEAVNQQPADEELEISII